MDRMSRDEKIEWIQTNLLPILESQMEEDFRRDPNTEQVNKSRRILAEEYLDEGHGIFKNFGKALLILLLVDLFTQIPFQAYGLVFSIIGTSIILVEGDILGSKSITVQSQNMSRKNSNHGPVINEKKARRLAHNTVITNVGLVWLITGFLLQLIASWTISSGTLLSPIEIPSI